ncbi:hypothetical protein GQ42DRAFT_30008 [Ramicandelaber brevisporus]|nr:hypothetical protein GQ42DRAFT_30008 [Ramicandelaber brevisporus]
MEQSAQSLAEPMFVDGSAVLSSKLDTDTQLIPADASIIWWKTSSPPQPDSKKQKKPMTPPEVCVAGRRQGISPAAFARGGSAAISMVSKRALFERYHRTLQLLRSHAKCATNLDVSGKTMRDVKNGATWHSKLKNLVKSIAPFDGWVQSPADCEDFSLS